MATGEATTPSQRGCVPAADPAIVETTEGALLAADNPTPVPLRIRRTGRLVAIYNDKAEFVCTVTLDPQATQTCFDRKLVLSGVFPLPRQGLVGHPLVIAATVGGWPVAIHAGLDGVAAADRCRRFLATVSRAAAAVAQGACPHPIGQGAAAMPGASLTYEFGTGRARQTYVVPMADQSQRGIVAYSRILRTLVRCEPIAGLINHVATPGGASCRRDAQGMAWRDTVTSGGSQARADPELAVTVRAYRLEIAGTTGNAHRSVAETEIWLEAGVPLATRYIVLSGRGPDGLKPQTEYSEKLTQIVLPAP